MEQEVGSISLHCSDLTQRAAQRAVLSVPKMHWDLPTKQERQWTEPALLGQSVLDRGGEDHVSIPSVSFSQCSLWAAP